MKSCLQTLRNIRNDCLWDWKRLLAFEIVYKLFGGLVLLPFFQLLIRKSLDFSGLQYLNMQVLFSWIQRPFSILTVVLVLLLLGLYVFYEIIFLVFYYEHAWNKQVFTLPGLLITCLQQVRRTLHPKNWSILLTILCLLPFSVLLLKPSSLSGIRIPEYFIDFLREAGTKYYAAYLLALLLINLLAFYMLHVIAVFLLQDKSFRTAFQECRLLLKKRKCRLLLQNLIMMAVVGIFLLLVYAFAIALLVLFADKENTASNRTAFLLNYMQWRQYADFLYPIILFSIGLFVMLYNFKSICGYQETRGEARKRTISWKQILLGTGELILTALLLGIYFDYQGNVYERLQLAEKPVAIAAHRAGTTFTPENTLPALAYAIQAKADYAEIDVQQSRDKKLYVMHDVNFKRTAGVNKNIWDVDSSEIDTYDAGSYFSYAYRNTRLPRLEDMIRKADGNIKLMIELKKNGHEKNLVEDTVALLQKYKFQKQCVIASMDLEILQRVKEIDPSFQTVYIAPVAYGNYYELPYVDIYSIESTFVNKSMLRALHQQNKQVFVRTVNRDKELQRLLSMDIDGIVTDNPELAAFYKTAKGRDVLISDLLAWLYPQKDEAVSY